MSRISGPLLLFPKQLFSIWSYGNWSALAHLSPSGGLDCKRLVWAGKCPREGKCDCAVKRSFFCISFTPWINISTIFQGSPLPKKLLGIPFYRAKSQVYPQRFGESLVVVSICVFYKKITFSLATIKYIDLSLKFYSRKTDICLV